MQNSSVLSKYLIRLPVLVLLIGFSSTCLAQFHLESMDENDDYYDSGFMRFDNFIYRDNVKSVLLHPTGWPIAPPFIQLNDPSSKLELHFDILDSAMGNFMYTLIHCDHDWKQSALDVQEYIDGTPEDFLQDYDFSRNTFQRYTHYSLEIPNDYLKLTKSGNYLLKVFDSDDGSLVLTRRFCVAENMVSIKTNVKQASTVNQRYSHQEIDFTIESPRYIITNPYQDLHVVVLQNHAWASALTGLQPRFIRESVLDYDHDGSNAMLGGNEYRLFDIKNSRFNGVGVSSVTYSDRTNHAYLVTDISRASMVYLQNRDLNGWYFIKNDLFGDNNMIDADYVHTHFKLKQPQAATDGDIYVFGALTDWKLIPEAKMKFNQLALEYEATLYLKQGLYNYIYVFVKDGDVQPDLTRFEGSHFETENEYSVLVYHREMGWDYDRLLGINTVIFPPTQ